MPFSIDFLILTLAFVMQHKSLFAFTRINFLLLGIALVTIFIGFILMSGSGSTDTQFNPEIFNTRRTVVAPMVCFVGYLFVIVAILYYRPKKDNSAVLKQTSDEQSEALKSQSSTAE